MCARCARTTSRFSGMSREYNKHFPMKLAHALINSHRCVPRLVGTSVQNSANPFILLEYGSSSSVLSLVRSQTSLPVITKPAATWLKDKLKSSDATTCAHALLSIVRLLAPYESTEANIYPVFGYTRKCKQLSLQMPEVNLVRILRFTWKGRYKRHARRHKTISR